TEPITVAFNRGPHDDPHEAAIDIADVYARMHGDGHDTSNDPVYVVNLKTGVPVLVDVGEGDFPIAVAHQDPYYPNDPHLHSNSILFETNEEGAGLTQADYTPARDIDFDGVLDHPNTLGPAGPGQIDGVDNVMSWYERQTDTLILQPILPMDEKTEYGVVLTDRLHGSGGDPVKSPFPSIYHPTQKDETARVRDILSDPNRSNYYGDIAGTGLDHVAFVWSFTTEPTYEDLRLLRDGLYGKGPLANLATLYPPTATAYPAIGLAATDADEPAGYQNDPRCAPHMQTPFILHPADAKDAIQLLIKQLFTQSQASSDAFISTFDQVDHVVTGTYQTPYFLGDPDHEDPDARFQIDFKNGIVKNAGSDKGHFFLTVPKKKPGQTEPFPVVLWAHGTSQSDAEIVARAGYFAAQGLAMFGIDMPGHGLALQAGQLSLAEGFFNDTCMVPFPYGLDQGRARDLNGDGILDSGGLLFTSHIFHSRDNLRQTVVDLLHASRILRAFGSPGTQDVNGDGRPDLMGDFDGDGVPDVGGPTQKIYAAGDSYGGIVSQIVGALDPNITAVAPISGSGGLTGIASRSFGVVDWVDEQIMTPLIVAVPASSRPPTTSGGAQTQCSGDQRSVRMVVNDLQNSREIEIACLNADELPENATILLANENSNELRCARAGKDGTFRVPVPADVGDGLALQIYDAPDVVDSYKTCNIQASA
ncbi:MAG: alpha/beta hydrolase family protein, partial [Polyangiaceae bacterium]